MKILIPCAGQAAVQLLEQPAAFMGLLDDREPFGYDFVRFAALAQALHGRIHLLLNGGDAAQIFKVIHHIQDQRRAGATCRERPPDLLLVNNGADGRAEQDHAGNAVHMDALVEHVDAEQ